MVKSFYIYSHGFYYPWLEKLPLDFSAASENSPRRTTFITTTVVPPEGMAETWRNRSFYPLKSCKDSNVQVQVEEEFEERVET